MLETSTLSLEPSSVTPEIYTGGYFQTNAYALRTPSHCLLIDAPEGSLDWTVANGWKVHALLLTHAHIDHVHDAAAIARTYGCPVYHHRDGLPLLLDRHAYRRFGLSIELEPVLDGIHIGEGAPLEIGGMHFELLLVPGHCPGSICFYDAAGGGVYAGDTLFAGSVGRSDLPGGDGPLLLRGIREKLFTLPPETIVHPGHGPATTIEVERASNPFLRA